LPVGCWLFSVSTEAVHLGLRTPDLFFELQYPFDTGDVEAAVDQGRDLTQARYVTAAVQASATGAAPRLDQPFPL
jgi:hypothetical protein